jgi:hypothetical protein
MDEEGELPEYPLLTRPLKRSRLAVDDVNTSSDPVFSSDGPEPSCEDYEMDRSKRQFRGAWWDGSVPARRHKFSRNMDSGIYLPSDGSDDNMTGTFTGLSSSTPTEFKEWFGKNQPPRQSNVLLPYNFDQARAIVARCIEDSRESFDLS